MAIPTMEIVLIFSIFFNIYARASSCEAISVWLSKRSLAVYEVSVSSGNTTTLTSLECASLIRVRISSAFLAGFPTTVLFTAYSFNGGYPQGAPLHKIM